jgi:hypothetical protein
VSEKNYLSIEFGEDKNFEPVTKIAFYPPLEMDILHGQALVFLRGQSATTILICVPAVYGDSASLNGLCEAAA